MSHICHARGCTAPVRPQLLMCRAHWGRVPAAIQHEVYATYRDGQCDDMRPSASWHDAASAAIGYVALVEGQGLSRGEVCALLRRGYEPLIVERYVAKMGETRREAILKVLGEEKAKIAGVTP